MLPVHRGFRRGLLQPLQRAFSTASSKRTFTARAPGISRPVCQLGASEWRGLSRRSEPVLAACYAARSAGALLLTPSRSYSSETEGFQEGDIGTVELLEMMERRDLQLIDVREPQELTETGIIPGAVNVPLGEVEAALKLSPELFRQKYGGAKPAVGDQNIVFSCMRGIRSRTALESALQLGYSNTKNYKPGWLGWAEHLERLK